MPTQKRRLAAYVPDKIYSEFQSFKSGRGIKGDSEALIVILSEFLQVSQEVGYEVSQMLPDLSETILSYLSPLKARLESLEIDLAKIKSKSESSYKSLFESLDRQIEDVDVTCNDSESDFLSELPEQLTELPEQLTEQNEPQEEKIPLSVEEIKKIVPSKSPFPQKIRLQGVELARRLNIGQTSISERKKNSPEKFAKWTSNKDPDGVPWFFVSEDGNFQPVGDLSDELKSELLKKSSEGLTTGELAKRLGLSSSTLSHWKKDKTPEGMLKAVRDKDPDGISWVFVSEMRRYVPETDLQNKHSSHLQGSLLGDSDSSSL